MMPKPVSLASDRSTHESWLQALSLLIQLTNNSKKSVKLRIAEYDKFFNIAHHGMAY